MPWLTFESLVMLAIGLVFGYLLGRIRPSGETIAPEDLDALIGRLSSMQCAFIERTLKNRSKIEAIKMFRKATGTGLYEAKKAVERMSAR